MHTCVSIRRPEGPLRGSIALPPSKSVANRALILAALAGDHGIVSGLGEAEDTRILHRLLRERPVEMHCGDGGTTLRFLLAWACVLEGEEHFITGNARLLERPHAPLVNALRELGADITAEEQGFRVRGRQLKGGILTLESPVSSQFISALLLVAPCFSEGLELRWTGQRLSAPYVRMTLDLLGQFGASASEDDGVITVENGPFTTTEIRIPADWSAAAFWFEAAALAPDTHLFLEGLTRHGVQGDEEAVSLFVQHTHCGGDDEGLILHGRIRGRPAPFHADLTDTPDLFQPLAFALAGLGRSAEFTGLHNLPLKETDRLKAAAEALITLGCNAEYAECTFKLEGQITNPCPPPFNPQGDHRMAMALAPLALVCEEITILHPEVVDKSYPGFWGEMKKAGFSVEFA